ncbi:MAG: bifunctional diaminohydroxyphosphoribosylaminopyrimidine deaminase/5-amino-6-(5-phosphoribosylamino)uracil reductase RibD [Crocinitomicaceae bacterium]|nr:bifunctional diaminohydroxyphosphoribosylaminopyrimidine deaminase/5-amino-6-(5-phosphoribosylamino)uracil reductase RibD [Crocinitomicaceae bacterium]
MNSDNKFMNRCLELARKGKGQIAPNPLVGAVIVHEGKIIGEGYHKIYGQAHAEVSAVNSVKDKSLLSEATIYVSLEPCAHFGKTPPCADLLTHHNFSRVVIGCTDTFDQVSGKGVEKLKNAGIEITIGVLEKECRELNKQFFTFHEKKRPFVFLKWAETTNGLIDNQNPKVIESNSTGEVTWISVPEVKSRVHQWRSEHMAILVGRKTVQADNPSLTVREVSGSNPVRVIIDSQAQLTSDYSVFNNEADTIILNTKKSEILEGIEYIQLDEINPETILHTLYQKGIQSIFIEGGARTLQSFIDANLWDQACTIIGQRTFEDGTKAPVIIGNSVEEQFFGDTLKHYRNQ